jgi:hypothetical protein
MRPDSVPDCTWRCETLLFLLRHADLRPTAKDLNLVMFHMVPLLGDDVPIEHLDECVRTLLSLGVPFWSRPVTRRIVYELVHERARLTREVEELRRAPHLIDAVVGLAHRYPLRTVLS